MDTQWTAQNSADARVRGWDIFEHYGSNEGDDAYTIELQLQALSDNPAGIVDYDAWFAVVMAANSNPPDALCSHAIEVLRVQSPAEYARIIGYVDSCDEAFS